MQLRALWLPALLLLPGLARAQALFTGLGDLPGGFPTSEAHGVSRGGAVVAGRASVDPGFSFSAFGWTPADGMRSLGALGGASFRSEAFDVSDDGVVIVGRSLAASGLEAFLWTEAGGMLGLGDLPGGDLSSTATGVSADGTVVVGTAAGPRNFEPFLWTASRGMVGLGDLPGGISLAFGEGVSSDGRVVVGAGSSADGFEAFRWTEAGGMLGLGDLPGGFFSSSALAASADGSVVVGFSRSGNGTEAFRWTEADGMLALGDLPGGSFFSEAHGVSADGAVIVGRGSVRPFPGSSLGAVAFRWTGAEGMRSVREWLETDFGLDLGGWALVEALDVSPDGRSIVGWGTNPDGLSEAWLAQVPPEVIPVRIDVRPGGAISPVRPLSPGVISVAVLGSADLDVTAIDPESLELGPEGAPALPGAPGRDAPRDVDGDGVPDRVFRFAVLESGIRPGAVELCLTGATRDGRLFEGCDAVRTVPDRGAAM